VKSLAGKAYLAHAREAFGSAGASAITELLDSVKLIYQRCPPESLKSTLTVVRGINATPLAPVIAVLGQLSRFENYGELATALLAATAQHHAIVEVASDGTFRVLISATDVDVVSLSQHAVVYRFELDTDRILAGKHSDFIPKVSNILKSNFATPTLTSLEEALTRYRDFVLETKCKILAGVWEGGVDGPRLVLTNRPEGLMRDSLVQTLDLLMRDATVRPEQNTDETKPVDIRIEWFGSGASALVEVKWLGRSTAKPQKPKPEPTYTDYDGKRVQEGADQLADYMDREVRHSQATAPRGYLVVFDARRQNVKGAADRLSKEDALHFEGSVLTLNPNHAKSREDFAEPTRFYLRPRATFFLAA